jgi:hypothetical protein
MNGPREDQVRLYSLIVCNSSNKTCEGFLNVHQVGRNWNQVVKELIEWENLGRAVLATRGNT